MYVEDVISMDITVVAESACTNDFEMWYFDIEIYILQSEQSNNWLIQQFGNDVHKGMMKIWYVVGITVAAEAACTEDEWHVMPWSPR